MEEKEYMSGEEINKILKKSEEDLKNFGMRRLLINNKYIYAEYIKKIEHDFETETTQTLEVVNLKTKTITIISKNKILIKEVSDDEIKHIYLNSKILKINVSDIILAGIVAFVETKYFYILKFAYAKTEKGGRFRR